MKTYVRKFISTETAKKLNVLLDSTTKEAKKKVKEILEGIEAIYILPNGSQNIDIHEAIETSDYNSVLLVTYPEFDKINSQKNLKKIIRTKIIMDLRR